MYKAFLISPDTIINENLPVKVNLTDTYNLYLSEDIKYESYLYHEDAVHILGYAFDDTVSIQNSYEVMKGILAEDLSSSSHYINHLNGSFVVIKVKDDNIEVFSDAAGFRSPYYTSDLKIVASHDKLIGDIYTKRKIHERINTLDYSRYEDVYKLVPSVKLTIGQDKVRIFPNDALKSYNYQEILSEMKKNIKYLNQALNTIENKLLVGITGGLDSKCTLALTKQIKRPINTFTYMKDIYSIQEPRAKQIYKHDKMIVNRLVKNINLNHEFIEFKVGDVTPEYSQNMYEITGTTFNHPIAEKFEEKYKKELEDVLQFRSVIFSNAKFDYPLAYLNYQLTIKDVYEHLGHKQLIGKSYEEVVKLADAYFNRTKTPIEETDIIKLLDIIHIDSRMGNWHSQLVKETDRVMDFFNYLNDRQTLNLLLQLPIEIRNNHLFHKDLINTYWPILNFFEDNGSGTLYDYEKQNCNQNINKSYGISELFNIQQELNREAMLLIPAVNLENTADMLYAFNINHPKALKLKSAYKNEKGRNYIKVIINNEKETKEIDIVDLSKGYLLEANMTYTIEIKYQKATTTASWVKAGTLYLVK
ncbi:hypothetical protein [Macrococcoides caseolyticum]|uniref:hypothetical protein n=1 Tax=Macrococcoides caseolyticum TaxID=69966 RepID=UPI001F1BE0FC|nr:hypothetical protein [Macrococcus caseolyticus]MCE4955680.1 hypothetical protein [Macrococcus caseolyticus]